MFLTPTHSFFLLRQLLTGWIRVSLSLMCVIMILPLLTCFHFFPPPDKMPVPSSSISRTEQVILFTKQGALTHFKNLESSISGRQGTQLTKTLEAPQPA